MGKKYRATANMTVGKKHVKILKEQVLDEADYDKLHKTLKNRFVEIKSVEVVVDEKPVDDKDK
jgi:hypothetical protein